MMVDEFGGQVALVTGASRGIGRAIAIRFAELGAKVAVHYQRNRQAAERTLSELPGDGHALFAADVSDPEAVPALVTGVADRLGGLDILINNAGICEWHRINDCAYHEWQAAWQHTLATNLLGPANLMFCAAEHMRTVGRGRIINISSRGAFRGEPEAPAYAASKAGLNAMSQSLAQALAPHGILVGVVAPGFIETDMAAPLLDGPGGDAIRQQSPLGRVGTPAEVAEAVRFLASERSMYSTGTIIDVNGASYLRP